MKLNNFINALLFGNSNYKIENDFLLSQLLYRLGKKINVQEIIRTGGLLLSHYIVQKDLNSIISYINDGNHHYYDGAIYENKPLLLQSTMAKTFFNDLSIACRGDLQMGATANRSIPDDDKQKFYKRKNELISLESSPKHYHNILKLYDMKCKSIGDIIDPFNFVLTPHTTFVDPIHWESIENFIEFIKHFPTNTLVETVKHLLYTTMYSILDADEELFPKNVLEKEEEETMRLFMENINIINNRVEKVDVDRAPPKLIDLFHRLLALLKLDMLWIKVNISKKPTINSSLCNIYTKLADLENENMLLRKAISSD